MPGWPNARIMPLAAVTAAIAPRANMIVTPRRNIN
jgi:hypothetical protein